MHQRATNWKLNVNILSILNNRLYLFAAKSQFDGVACERKLRNKRKGLFFAVVLTKRNKVIILPVHKLAYIFRRGGKPVIRGNR